MLNLVPWRTPFSISPGFPHVWLGKTVGGKKGSWRKCPMKMHLYHKISSMLKLLKSARSCNRKINHCTYKWNRKCVRSLEYLPCHIFIMAFKKCKQMHLVNGKTHNFIHILSSRRDLDDFGNNEIPYGTGRGDNVWAGVRMHAIVFSFPQTWSLLTCIIHIINWYPVFIYLETASAVPCLRHITNI